MSAIDMDPGSDHDPDAYMAREAELKAAWLDGWVNGVADAGAWSQGKDIPPTPCPYERPLRPGIRHDGDPS